MSENVIELYSDEDVARLRQKIKRWTVGLCILAGIALAVCIAMAAIAGTATADQLEFATIAVSTVAGWVVIYDAIFVVSAKRKELSHAEMLKSEQWERMKGRPVLTGRQVRIKKSIVAKQVELQGSGQEVLVCETKAKILEKADAIAVYTAHGYVAAYEVRS